MRVIGIDPGTAVTGYGVVESEGNRLEAVAYGVIRTSSKLPAADRLAKIHGSLKGVIAEHKPEVASIERLFVSKNPSAALAVGQARGVSLLAAVNAGLEVAEFSPVEVKQAVVGYGKADKSQVQEMVKVLLGLSEVPRPDDAADALALAICRLHTAPIKEDE
jgi:crossover junction endodeoxyribonuclease RuvC